MIDLAIDDDGDLVDDAREQVAAAITRPRPKRLDPVAIVAQAVPRLRPVTTRQENRRDDDGVRFNGVPTER